MEDAPSLPLTEMFTHRFQGHIPQSGTGGIVKGITPAA